MAKEYLVSIVTPSYNHGRFIEDTILSIKNQDYPNIEHLVIDGGSIDNTIEILKKYEKDYNLTWISEPDKGQADAVNKGFRMAKGEIIGWLNSDDVYFDKEVIRYLVYKFKEFEDVHVIYGDEAIIDEEGTIQAIIRTFNWDYNRLLRWDFIYQPATFFRHQVILENQLEKNLHLSMDYDFWLKLGMRYKFIKVNKILAGDRLHSGTKRLSNREKHIIESRNLKAKYGQKFGLSYYLKSFCDELAIGYKRIIGVKEVLNLTNYNNLAFKARIPDKISLIKTQIPFKSMWNILVSNMNIESSRSNLSKK